MSKTITLFLGLWLGCLAIQAQSGVTGLAEIVLEDGGTECNGAARIIHVFADVTGLTGAAGHPVGLNSFVLTIELDGSVSNTIFASASPGDYPDFSWNFCHTSREAVHAGSFLTLVGWVAYSDIPSDQNYFLASIVLSGAVQNVTLDVNVPLSSLASRIVDPPDGDGPGLVGIQNSVPLTTQIPLPFTLHLNSGVGSWLENNAVYDLAVPYGPINVCDLVKLINCGA